MEVFRFIFGLGVTFSIFGFIWGIIMLLINMVRGRNRTQVQDYGFRIIKYFFLISVTANYIVTSQEGGGDSSMGLTNTVLGVIVLGLYLMGKLQNRTMINQLSNNPMFARFTNSIDPKVERFLLIGSVIYFVFCMQFPAMVDNAPVNWFTESIINIYDTPIIGWVFSIIGFFFLVTIILRGANVIGSLVTGQPLNSGPKGKGFGNFQAGGSNPFEQFRQQRQQEDDFVDYEDVTDQEDEEPSTNDDTEDNRLN